jgi:hypothetical protein
LCRDRFSFAGGAGRRLGQALRWREDVDLIVAENNARELPQEIRNAAIGEADPDARIVRMLSARGTSVPQTDGDFDQNRIGYGRLSARRGLCSSRGSPASRSARAPAWGWRCREYVARFVGTLELQPTGAGARFSILAPAAAVAA